MFFHPYHHAGLWLAAVCPVASRATNLVLWHHVCSGRLSLVSGSGLCPPRPSSPWQAAQEHFLGRYRPPHVCPRPFGPPENTWCSVFLLTCTIQWSCGTNWKWPSLKPLMLQVQNEQRKIETWKWLAELSPLVTKSVYHLRTKTYFSAMLHFDKLTVF